MKLRLSSISKRSDSQQHQFVQRVPRDVAERLKGRLVLIEFPAMNGAKKAVVTTTLNDRAKFSLRTTDPNVARARHALAIAHLQRIYAAERHGPAKLDHIDIVAYAGEVYRLFVQDFERNPGSRANWVAFKAFTRAAKEGRIAGAPPIQIGRPPQEADAAQELFGSNLTAGIDALPQSDDTTALEMRFGTLVSWVLNRHGLNVDAGTRAALLRQVAVAALKAGKRLRNAADGDYSPDPAEAHFPPVPKSSGTGKVTLSDLFDRWQRETNPSGSTVTSWRSVVRSLKIYLKHEDAARITEEDAIGWKDSLVDRGLKAKTISDGHLAAARRLFAYGVNNKLLKSNPIAGVKITGKRRAGEGMQAYTDEEVGRLLALAKAETHPTRRWLPWLAALTGARIGELAQIWGSNVRKVDGIYVLDIQPAPDGGSLKNLVSERTIPLHPAIIQEGFLAFVDAKGSGPLFYTGQHRKHSKDSHRHASKGVTNRLATWIREQGFRDPRKAPAHALRHWWKSAASKVEIQDSVADAIQGHAGKTDAATYRHFDIRTLAKAVAAIPVPPLSRETPEPVPARSRGREELQPRRRLRLPRKTAPFSLRERRGR